MEETKVRVERRGQRRRLRWWEHWTITTLLILGASIVYYLGLLAWVMLRK